MNIRKLQALRNLAERPGTEAEGALARELLAKAEGRRRDAYPPDEADAWIALEDYISGSIRTEEYLERLDKHYSRPTTWVCACGAEVFVRQKCLNGAGHAVIQETIRSRFKKGDRVFYNYWAYGLNSPATVVGYVKPTRENGSHPWAWIRLKFDHLKNSRQAPIWSEKGCHLSFEPLSPEAATRLARP